MSSLKRLVTEIHKPTNQTINAFEMKWTVHVQHVVLFSTEITFLTDMYHTVQHTCHKRLLKQLVNRK